jgi:hypothetical protein
MGPAAPDRVKNGITKNPGVAQFRPTGLAVTYSGDQVFDLLLGDRGGSASPHRSKHSRHGVGQRPRICPKQVTHACIANDFFYPSTLFDDLGTEVLLGLPFDDKLTTVDVFEKNVRDGVHSVYLFFQVERFEFVSPYKTAIDPTTEQKAGECPGFPLSGLHASPL